MSGRIHKSSGMKPVLLRYIQYIVTSAAGAVVEVIVLWLLSDYVLDGSFWNEYIVSPIIAFQCSIPVNYIVASRYVWKDRGGDRKGLDNDQRLRRVILFALVTTLIFIARIAALLVVEACFQWDVVVCSLVAMVVSGLLNFIISNKWIFTGKEL